jgi:hypothetical protein
MLATLKLSHRPWVRYATLRFEIQPPFEAVIPFVAALARIIHRIDRSGDDLVDVRDSDEGHRDFRP